MRSALIKYSSLPVTFVLLLLVISLIPSPVNSVSEGTELRATAEEDSILLEWNEPYRGGITGYRIYRGLAEDQRYVYQEVGKDQTSYRDEEVEEGRTYKYWVTILEDHLESQCSETVSATLPGANTPTPPTEFKAYPGNSTAVLTWNRPLDNGNRLVKNYRIFRAEEDGDLEFIHAAGTVYKYEDRAVRNGVTYRYRIKARNNIGLSEEVESSEIIPSQEFNVPEVPRNLRSFRGSDFVDLIWDEPTEDGGTTVYEYRIHRDGAHISTVREEHFRDSDIGTSAIYSISAINAVGESGLSIEKQIGLREEKDEIQIPLTIERKENGAHLSWYDLEHSTAYLIYRGNEPESLSPYEIVEENEFTDSEVEFNRRYYYRVVALEGESLRDESNTIGFTPTEVEEDPGFDYSIIIRILIVSLIIAVAVVIVLFFIHIKKPKGPK